MTYRRHTFVNFLLSLGLLSACGPLTVRDTEQQAFIPLKGGTFELHRDIAIPPGRTRVFLQDGRLTPAINEFEPHCQVRVRQISDQSQPVQADRFSIGKVFGTLDQVVSGSHVRLASTSITIMAGGGGGGNGLGESRQMYLYFMGLQSERQPNVTFFVCGGALEEPALAQYPTLQEIRAAIGDHASLTLPTGQ